jgi:ubiquinone/menaquinone biosynthesis C-methylase UbiE
MMNTKQFKSGHEIFGSNFKSSVPLNQTPQTKVVDIAFNGAKESRQANLAASGYALAKAGALTFSQFVEPNVRVLDIGCGVGLVGQILSKLGFQDILGIDLSTRSLEIAQRTKAYSSTLVHNLVEKLPFPDNSFGAAIGIDVLPTFNSSELSNILGDLSRVTAAKGMIVFSYREDLNNSISISDTILQFTQLKLLYVTDPPELIPMIGEGRNLAVRYFVLQNLK